MFSIKCILCPTDFSDCSSGALSIACSLARDYGARIIMLHVAPLPIVGSAEIFPVAQLPPDLEMYRSSIEEQVKSIPSPDPKVSIERRVTLGDAVSDILDVAQESACDLIVLGTHGRTGFGRLLMGSVAEKIVRTATCPVLTVKSAMPEHGAGPTANTGNAAAIS